MDKIRVKDKEFELFISAEKINETISRIADQLNTDLKGKDPLFMVILNGAFMFAGDLIKKITVDCEVSFVKLSSYSGTRSTAVVKELIGLNEVLRGRTVVVIEDIIDTGVTMELMIGKLKEMDPRDVKIVTFLFKPEALTKDFAIDYVGIEIPNKFIVGYGLDYDGFGRNLPDIYKIATT
ncbi:MAG: hypoxanthine phosphoribosyltransferase [Bacteroidales bacterium]